MEVYEFFDNANAVNKTWLINVVTEFLNLNEVEIVEMIKAQWTQGENEEGKPVGRYKPVTEGYYAKVNPPSSGMPKIAGQPYNLMWDGTLINRTGIKVEIKNEELILTIDSTATSKDPLFQRIKAEKLVSDPESIFGLQTVNLGKVTDMSEENLVDQFYKTLKLE